MATRMPLWAAKDSVIMAALAGPIPETSVSRSGALSSTSSARAPKVSTMAFAVTGPMPLMSPEPRYFSTADFVSGRVVSYRSTRICCP